MKIGPLVQTLRPRQWLKNTVVFAPLVFSGKIHSLAAVGVASVAFVSLCCMASALYILNDLNDQEVDRRHPTKRARPIASGALGRGKAMVALGVLALLGFIIAGTLGIHTVAALTAFVLVNVVYSMGGKQVAILDAVLIGGSFVCRVVVGAAALSVPASAWLLLTLFFLATYLCFTKRAAEQGIAIRETRASLATYTPTFLAHAASSAVSVTLALYTLYTFDSPFGNHMAVTVPIVFFGLLRYQAIVDQDSGENDGPSTHIYSDVQLQAAVILWGIVVLCIVWFYL